MKKSTPYRKRGGLQHVGIERRTLREEHWRELSAMDMLSSRKGLIVKVDIDSGYVYDFGFNTKPKWD